MTFRPKVVYCYDILLALLTTASICQCNVAMHVQLLLLSEDCFFTSKNYKIVSS